MSSPLLLTYMSCSVVISVAAVIAMVRFAPVPHPDGTAGGSRPFAGSLVCLLVWLVVAVALALSGVYIRGTAGMPTIQFGILLPIFLGVAAYVMFPGIKRWMHSLPQSWLVGVQAYRVIGVIFVILWVAGQLPAVFALPAGLGDMAIGLAAPFAARRGRNAVLWWNVLGIADLVVALTTGFLTSPSRFQVFALDAPNVLVGQFPLILIPTFLVPMSILLHLASLAVLKVRPG